MSMGGPSTSADRRAQDAELPHERRDALPSRLRILERVDDLAQLVRQGLPVGGPRGEEAGPNPLHVGDGAAHGGQLAGERVVNLVGQARHQGPERRQPGAHRQLGLQLHALRDDLGEHDDPADSPSAARHGWISS